MVKNLHRLQCVTWQQCNILQPSALQVLHNKGLPLQELFPGTFVPTPAHFFIKLLHDKGLLLRCFTQNIDSLEHQAGLPKEAIVAAHGNFDSKHEL